MDVFLIKFVTKYGKRSFRVRFDKWNIVRMNLHLNWFCNLSIILTALNRWRFYYFYRNKKRFHHQALVEVEILEHLRKKDLEANASHNVIHMLEYFYFRNHLCITFELMRYMLFFNLLYIFSSLLKTILDTILEMTNR